MGTFSVSSCNGQCHVGDTFETCTFLFGGNVVQVRHQHFFHLRIDVVTMLVAMLWRENQSGTIYVPSQCCRLNFGSIMLGHSIWMRDWCATCMLPVSCDFCEGKRNDIQVDFPFWKRLTNNCRRQLLDGGMTFVLQNYTFGMNNTGLLVLLVLLQTLNERRQWRFSVCFIEAVSEMLVSIR